VQTSKQPESEQQEFPWAAIDDETRPSSLEEREAFIDRLPVCRGDRTLLKALAAIAFDGDGIRCDPSLTELQELMNCVRQTVIARISRCEEAKVLKVDRDDEKFRMLNIYILQIGEMVDLVNTKRKRRVVQKQTTRRSRLRPPGSPELDYQGVQKQTTQQLPYVNALCNENVHAGDSNSGKKKNKLEVGGVNSNRKTSSGRKPLRNFFKSPSNDLIYHEIIESFFTPSPFGPDGETLPAHCSRN